MRRVAAIAVILVLSSVILFSIPAPVSAQGEDPHNIDLYLDGEVWDGDLTPVPPGRKTALQAGTSGIQLVGTPVGSWSTNELSDAISIFGPFTANFWMKSNDNAKNTKLRLEVRVGTTTVGEYNSSQIDLSSTPVLITMAGNLNVDLVGGEALSAHLFFYCDGKPPFPLITPSDATLLYGGSKYDSKITVRTSPVHIEIPEPEVDPNVDYVGLRVRIIEVFDVEPAKLAMNLTISGPTYPKHMSNASFTKEEEFLIISWEWKYIEDKAKDGDYTFNFMLSYDGNLTFTNTSRHPITFPPRPVTDISEAPWEDMVMPAIVIGAAIIILLLIWAQRTGKLARAIKRMKKRKKARKKGKKPSKAKPKKKAKEEE